MPAMLLTLSILNALAAGWQANILLATERAEAWRAYDNCTAIGRIRGIGGRDFLACVPPSAQPSILLAVFLTASVILLGMWLLARETRQQETALYRRLAELESRMGKKG